MLDAADYAGIYHSSTRNSLSLVAEQDRLLLQYQGQAVPLERRTRDSFLVHHPDFALFLLEFSREGAQVDEAFHGSDRFVREGLHRSGHLSYSKLWESYVGHYRARNPELSNFRIAVRKGVLTLLNPWGNTEPLTPLSEGRFRIGSDRLTPETLEFSAMAGGRALRADYTGCPYYRTFEQ